LPNRKQTRQSKRFVFLIIQAPKWYKKSQIF
jgi:hypothetical protein